MAKPAPGAERVPKKLAGGFIVGNEVVSTIDFEEIRTGDFGTVVGPCDDDEADDKDQRVCVDYGEGGHLNPYTSQIKLAPLACGYLKGDKVKSLIAFKALKIGDEGTVEGQCTNNTVADKELRLNVNFGKDKVFNMKVTQIKPVLFLDRFKDSENTQRFYTVAVTFIFVCGFIAGILTSAIFAGGLCDQKWQIHSRHSVGNHKCISRDDCPHYGVCENRKFELELVMDADGELPHFAERASGTCKACTTFPREECYPPCHFDGEKCLQDRFSFWMRQDLEEPYYFNILAAILKPLLTLMVFQEEKMPDPVDAPWAWFKMNMWRLVFFIMAFNAWAMDFEYHWELLFYANMCTWMRIWAFATSIASSSNLIAAASIIELCLSGIVNEDKWKDFDNPYRLSMEMFGGVFTAYCAILVLFYIPAMILLFILVIPGAFLYFWITAIYFFPAAKMSKSLSKPLADFYLGEDFRNPKSSSKAAEKTDPLLPVRNWIKKQQDSDDDPDDEAEEKKKKDKKNKENKEKAHIDYFRLRLPLIMAFTSFMIPLSARLFNGYGYFEGFGIVLYERHIPTFLRECRYNSRLIDFFWTIL